MMDILSKWYILLNRNASVYLRRLAVPPDVASVHRGVEDLSEI